MAHAPLGLRLSVWMLVGLLVMLALLALGMIWVSARQPGGTAPQPAASHPQSLRAIPGAAWPMAG